MDGVTQSSHPFFCLDIFEFTDKGKPVVKQGRKAVDTNMEDSAMFWDLVNFFLQATHHMVWFTIVLAVVLAAAWLKKLFTKLYKKL
jgi:hypothetical protein